MLGKQGSHPRYLLQLHLSTNTLLLRRTRAHPFFQERFNDEGGSSRSSTEASSRGHREGEGGHGEAPVEPIKRALGRRRSAHAVGGKPHQVCCWVEVGLGCWLRLGRGGRDCDRLLYYVSRQVSSGFGHVITHGYNKLETAITRYEGLV